MDTTLCDKVCQWLATGRFSLGIQVSSTNKTDRHDITEILLKVAFNTINLNPTPSNIFLQEKIEDNKGVIRNRKLKDRQYVTFVHNPGWLRLLLPPLLRGVSNCCFISNEQFFSCYDDEKKVHPMSWWWWPLCTRHIILIASQPVFALTACLAEKQ
jgi:hypothetical protein